MLVDSRSKRRIALSALACAMVTSCAESTGDLPVPAVPVAQEYADALLEGTLAVQVVDGRACFSVETDYSGPWGLVLPEGFSASPGTPTGLRGIDGQVVAVVGDAVRVGGGDGGGFAHAVEAWEGCPEMDIWLASLKVSSASS